MDLRLLLTGHWTVTHYWSLGTLCSHGWSRRRAIAYRTIDQSTAVHRQYDKIVNGKSPKCFQANVLLKRKMSIIFSYLCIIWTINVLVLLFHLNEKLANALTTLWLQFVHGFLRLEAFFHWEHDNAFGMVVPHQWYPETILSSA